MQPVGHLAAARERVWISGKQDRDLAPVAREADHLIDRFERCDVCVRGCEVQQSGAATIAVADDIGFLHGFDGLHGGKSWMTWSDADEPDPAHATTTPIPTRDTADRLELSAHHVVRQRRERIACFAGTERAQMRTRGVGMFARLLERTLRSVAIAHRLDDVTRFVFTESPAVFERYRREHQRKGRESIMHVVADGLADLAFRGGVVEDV